MNRQIEFDIPRTSHIYKVCTINTKSKKMKNKYVYTLNRVNPRSIRI